MSRKRSRRESYASRRLKHEHRRTCALDVLLLVDGTLLEGVLDIHACPLPCSTVEYFSVDTPNLGAVKRVEQLTSWRGTREALKL